MSSFRVSKRFNAFTSAFILILTLCNIFASPTNVDLEFAKASNKFATEIYQKAIEGKSGNVVISPVSIETALALAMFGATGQTRQEMQSGLKYPATYGSDVIAENFKTFTNNVRHSNGVSIANKIFLKKNYSIKRSFNDVAVRSFASEAQNLDFSKNVQSAATINEWVEEHTNNKIKNLISANSLDASTSMVLVNALYFKGFWIKPFDDTFKAHFHLGPQKSVFVDFMKIEKGYDFGVLSDLDATAIELPYRESDMYMLIILPNSPTGLSALEKKLHNVDLSKIRDRLDKRTDSVTIPKFKIEFDIELSEALKKMGMSKMFGNADFTDLLESSAPITVSKVVHKVFIEVKEDGTEAAAATAIQMVGSGMYMPHVEIHFKADHPFIFALINLDSSRTFFLGRVVEF